MGKALRWLVGSLAGLLLLMGAIMLLSRLLPPSAAQKRALVALEAPRDMPGSNAYATLATLGMEGAREQRQAQVDAHVAEYAAWHAGFIAHTQRVGGWDEATMEARPQLGAGENALSFDPVLCRQATGCLDRVRGQPQAVADALLPQATVLAQMDELAAHGHYRSPLPPDAATPVPAMRPLFVPLAAHALAHVQGDSQCALAGLCRDAGTGRMLLDHGDNLLTGMVGGAMLAANAELFADVLAELPVDAPIPAACFPALAPLTPQEASNCASMQGEFTMVSSSYSRTAQVMPEAPGWVTPQMAKLLYDRDKSVARVAETMGQACLPETWQAIAEDRTLPPPPVLSMWRLECAANAVGCVLSGIAGPAYSSYVARQQDTAARLRLLQAALWLRGQAVQGTPVPLAERVDNLPAGLRSAYRPITLSADGTALETPAYGKDGQVLRMPLPQALSSR